MQQYRVEDRHRLVTAFKIDPWGALEPIDIVKSWKVWSLETIRIWHLLDYWFLILCTIQYRTVLYSARPKEPCLPVLLFVCPIWERRKKTLPSAGAFVDFWLVDNRILYCTVRYEAKIKCRKTKKMAFMSRPLDLGVRILSDVCFVARQNEPRKVERLLLGCVTLSG